MAFPNCQVCHNPLREATHSTINFWLFHMLLNLLTTPNIVSRPSPCWWKFVLQGVCVVYKQEKMLSIIVIITLAHCDNSSGWQGESGWHALKVQLAYRAKTINKKLCKKIRGVVLSLQVQNTCLYPQPQFISMCMSIAFNVSRKHISESQASYMYLHIFWCCQWHICQRCHRMFSHYSYVKCSF